MNEFKAKEVYKNEAVVQQYDAKRFFSLKGKATDWLEKRLIRKALNITGLKAGSSVLDIPCGTGRLSYYLNECGYKVVGADISEAMLKAAKEKNVQKEEVTFVLADAEKLPFPEDSFDVTVSLRLLGHVPPIIRERMLTEFARVTKGYLILAYYHKNSLQNFLRRKKRNALAIPWYPLTFKAIKDETVKAGLQLLAVLPLAIGFSETVVIVAKKYKFSAENKATR